MAQTRIPTEILLDITTYLSPNEKRTSLLICKDWYEIFRYGLYSTISIQTLYQLKLLFKSLLISHHSFVIPNGHLVKNLIIHKRTELCIQKLLQERVIIPKQLFEQLPNLCPNLEVLDFDPETWKFIHYHENITKWKSNIKQLPTLATMCTLPFLQRLGESLSTLSIQSEMMVDISTQQKLYCILSLVPNLNHLEILGNKSTTTLVLDLEDIEFIHQLLPCLESFKIIGENIQMVEPTFKNNNFPTTATLIKSLHWNTFLTPVTWILYVTHKYPSLTDLTLAIKNNTSSLQDQQQTLYYIQLLKQCQQLKHISLSSHDMSDWFNTYFFDVILQSSCIKQICPLKNKENQIRFDSELGLALKIKHLITSLEIEQWRLDNKLPFTIQVLRNFTQLNHLELRCDSYNDIYDMDIILDSCPVLDSLIFTWGTLSISNNLRHKHHSLRSLNITFVAFHSTTFQYLSNRCKSLSNLTITRCKQLCALNDIATQTVIHLNMPLNTFDLVVLDGVRLDYSIAASMLSGPNYIRILSINHQWYQHIGYINRKTPRIQLLDKNDTEITNNYFLKREQCSFENSHHRFLETLSEQKVNPILKTNFMFGVIKIKCKAVKNFVLDGNFTTSSAR